MSMTITMDRTALRALFDKLDEDVAEAVRPAAQAAAQVLYNEVMRNVGSIGVKSGNLGRSIYQVYSAQHSGPGQATYHVSWNARKAPHGHLVENGYIQRYASYVGKDGKWHTAVRSGMQGKPRPSRRASQAVKDAYYVPRPGGPVQWLGKAFVRRAVVKMPEAVEAATVALLKRMGSK